MYTLYVFAKQSHIIATDKIHSVASSPHKKKMLRDADVEDYEATKPAKFNALVYQQLLFA